MVRPGVGVVYAVGGECCARNGAVDVRCSYSLAREAIASWFVGSTGVTELRFLVA